VAITKEGRWLLSGDGRELLAGGRDALPGAFEVEGAPVTELPEPGVGELLPLDDLTGSGAVASTGFDVVIPLLHGPYGEDGTVQGLFELAGVPYVGAGVVGSAVAMDKVMMKHAFAAAGLPVARWRSLREGHDVDAFAAEVEVEVGLPCFVKPANLGSSVGVSKVEDRASLYKAVDLALGFDEWVIAEEAIVGREIEVGILGDDPPLASVPGEIVPGDDFYSYADKYEKHDAELLVPAPLSKDQVADVGALAVRAFEACRGEAMARVDFFLEEGRADGTPARGFIVNEVNTIPGFTQISMYPRLWEASGVSFGDLLDRLIALARARHERRTRRAGPGPSAPART
jgi:D-alanine-D-alanine ligase